MDELGPGLYESLITEGLKAQLEVIVERSPSSVRALRAAEAPDRIAWHLSKQMGLPRVEVTGGVRRRLPSVGS